MKEQNQTINNMIQPSELRLGNWVRLEWDGKCSNLPITGIIEDRVWFAEYDDFDIACIHPIPLTPEILDKCEFKKNDDHSHWHIGEGDREFYQIRHAEVCYENGKFFWVFSCEDDFYSWLGTQILYFHQLQNIFFALCGEELNFKP